MYANRIIGNDSAIPEKVNYKMPFYQRKISLYLEVSCSLDVGDGIRHEVFISQENPSDYDAHVKGAYDSECRRVT